MLSWKYLAKDYRDCGELCGHSAPKTSKTYEPIWDPMAAIDRHT